MPMSDHTVELRSVDTHRVLRVLSAGPPVPELVYDPPIIDPPLSETPPLWLKRKTLISNSFFSISPGIETGEPGCTLN